jgi:hypothetical protein
MDKKNIIDYNALVDDAMHLIVKKSLEIFANNDLEGDHHFFISFVTKYPGVIISEKLHKKYPYEMTIVLQYQFENLQIDERGFSVSLSFDGKKESISIPFAALTAFADPSAKFGLQFRHADNSNLEDDDSSNNILTESFEPKTSTTESIVSDKKKDNVIALDFRNKKRK